MKFCKKCNLEKSRDEFNNDASRKDGKHAYCRPCKRVVDAKSRASRDKVTAAETLRKYARENKASIAEKRKEYSKKNAVVLAEYQRKYRAVHAEKLAADKRRWNCENKDHVAKRKREYADANPHVGRKSSTVYIQRHPERRKEIAMKYVQNNPDKSAAIAAARRAQLLNATPRWANRREIGKFYTESARLRSETGVEHHVDHIVPLRNKLVCGLHTPANLQVLTAFENCSKNNRVWPDMP